AFASAAFTDKNAGNGKTVTVSGISLGGADAGNYVFATSTTTTADITKRSLSITAAAGRKVYDATTIAHATPADDRMPGDALTVTFGSASFADKNAGRGKVVTVSGI